MNQSRRQIRIVTPVVGVYPPEVLAALGDAGSEVTNVGLSDGPGSLESGFEESFSVPETLLKVVAAERAGVDAVVIDCMRDPGLQVARELVSIPVVGPAEATMHLASMLGHRFSIVTVLSRLVPLFENLGRVYGVGDKLASVRSVEIPVLELEKDANRLLRALVDQSVNCIVEDGAHVIVFGCTGMLGYAGKVLEGLKRLGHEGIPVIDPLPTAVRTAELFVDLRLSQSKRTYPKPSSEWVESFDFSLGSVPGRGIREG